MFTYNIIEKFISIDGEGPLAGELAVFIRFQGCNLRCDWCDTAYSWNDSSTIERLTAEEIYSYIKQCGITHVTLTGGEPLIQKNIDELLELLINDGNLLIHIETNGSVSVRHFIEKYKSENLRYIVDFKLFESKMIKKMDLDNLRAVRKVDVYKFVIGSRSDLEKAYEVIKDNNLNIDTQVYLSPVSDRIAADEIVEFMKLEKIEGIKLQLQLHKFIWHKEARGV